MTLAELLDEYDRALAYTDTLWRDLDAEAVGWRPDEQSSAIGWHLGHQAAVAHFMLRNLTAAEPRLDPALEALMDSATPEPARGDLPSLDRLADFRADVGRRVRSGIGRIDRGAVGAPAQLRVVAATVLTVVINHEYQHDQWIGEVRNRSLGLALPPRPASPRLTELDGYVVLAG